MRALDRWWVRASVYGVVLVVTAWVSYRLAYRHYAGPHPDDSDGDLGWFYGAVWSAGATAAVLVTVAAVEAARAARIARQRSR